MLRRTAALMAVAMVTACGGADDSTPGTTGGSAAGNGALPMVELPEGVTQDMVAAGQQVFNQQTCFTCHGRNATGSPLAPALNDGEWLNTDGSFDEIVRVIREGVAQPVQFPAPMPAMGGAPLSEDQIRQVAAYVYAVSR
ncbi:MAG TPA: c-type cytochrome [Longimicrobiales bacterium]|nr:c-type cytochrome [Longimicrobiales bacterium]